MSKFKVLAILAILLAFLGSNEGPALCGAPKGYHVGPKKTIVTKQVGWVVFSGEQPTYFSGTNAKVYVKVVIPSQIHWFSHVALKVNSTLVQAWDGQDAGVCGDARQVELCGRFDSTRMDSPVKVNVETTVNLADDPDGDLRVTTLYTSPTYNKAFSTRNLDESMAPDSTNSYLSVRQIFTQSNYENNKYPLYPKSSLLYGTGLTNGLNTSTAFYMCTHGITGGFRDGNNTGYYEADMSKLIKQTDISNAIASVSAKNIPPYSFAFVNACDSAGDDSLAAGFGIGAIDQAFVGWSTNVYTSDTTGFASYLMASLEFGHTVETSRSLAQKQVNPLYAVYDPNVGHFVEKSAISKVIGDPNMTLHHQVYTGKSDPSNHNEDAIGEPGYPKCLTTPN